MRPAEAVAKWSGLSLDKSALKNVSMLEAQTLNEEASVIALMMRGQLENKGKSAALVTNDRGLAKRVSKILQRWNIDVDDSAGIPVANSEAATFLLLLSEMVAQRISPISLLSVLKHNLCTCGYKKNDFAKIVSELEINILRGPRIEGGLDGIKKIILKKELLDLIPIVEELQQDLEEFVSLFVSSSLSFEKILLKNIELAEKLSMTEGDVCLWRNEKDFRQCLEDIVSSSQGIEIDPLHYNKFLKSILEKALSWPQSNKHPRLSILSPMEARLQHFDLMILGEVNKGSWPLGIQTNWLSKTMRLDMGLPPEETLFGLAAHDFASFLFAPEVVVSRAKKVNTSPTIPSSWWLRMETIAKVSGLEEEIKCDDKWRDWAGLLDANCLVGDRGEIKQPAPAPPVQSRPRMLSVTQIEKLIRDPYSIYASHILKLKKLKDLDAEPDMSDYGNIIHNILERFIKNYKEGSYEELIECGRMEFAEFAQKPSITALWWPRFEKIAEWFVVNEVSRRIRGVRVFSEIDGYVLWQSDAGEFKLRARADRIEVGHDDNVSIIDYKTGSLPSKKDMKSGLSPQIPLEGWILEQGGFTGIMGIASELACWKVNIGDDLGKIVKIDNLSLNEVGDSIKDLIKFFDNPEVSYIACPDDKLKPIYNDYEHLERLKEWG
jgi:ATP-dependent helicase/nuclease subunit B